ncbi:MAG: alcohol dehydrogenase, partial [Bradyrhizobium sp.]|nr:alcohol dehydrogenase [Bradyrhizobium sp.]
MKALVYHGPGQKSVDERPKPTILEPGDAVVKILKTT